MRTRLDTLMKVQILQPDGKSTTAVYFCCLKKLCALNRTQSILFHLLKKIKVFVCYITAYYVYYTSGKQLC